MASFLQLVNNARREAGVSGAALLSLGGTLSEESARFKAWVADAWTDLQTEKGDLDFLRAEFSFSTVAAQRAYTTTDAGVNASFANWKPDTSVRAYRISEGVGDEQVVPFIPYQQFRDLYNFGTNRTLQQRPTFYTIDPTKQLLFGPTPDAVYNINGEYYKAPAALTADADVPAVEDKWHPLIVWYALRYYAYFESATEVLARAELHIDRLLPKFLNDRLPQIGFGAPLA
jgi:hypothetical protein